MIFDIGQHMADNEKERGRLFSIQIDGSSRNVPFIIKKDKLLIGRGDTCEIRIYVDGVAHEHCSIIFNEEGRGFVEPVNKCGFTYLNRKLIERQVSLEHGDEITVVKRSFRFYYPSSSKFNTASEPAASFEDSMVKALADYEAEMAKKGKESPEKRVTFGPRLSPEEFDKRMPPASPLRRGSLPREKFKAKTPSLEQDVIKSQIKKNLFMNSPANRVMKANVKSATPSMPESSVLLHRLNYSNGTIKHSAQDNTSEAPKPLFSEIVKKSVSNPPKNAQNVAQRYSANIFLKKTKQKDSRKILYKSPRRPVNPRLLAVGSTGHANSPETIVINKRRFNPNSPRNAVSVVKRRKSLRLIQEKALSETGSENQNSVHGESTLMFQNSAANENITQNVNLPQRTPVRAAKAVTRKSFMKQKINDENTDNTPSSSRSEDFPSRKNTPIRKSISTPSRKSISTPAKKSSRTPSRKSIATPARKSIGTPARKSISTPARESTIVVRSEDEISDEVNEDEVVNEFDDNEQTDEFAEEEELHEDENDVPSENGSGTATPANSSSLVAAINNVAQIDENNLDRSLNDIQNIVQALSCRSNVPSLGSDRLTADMCMNAVKKLALTISMINAFHMYNRIIDDVSNFPLCFPSTSFDSNRRSLRQLPRTAGHQNEDNIRMSQFQDIMQTFFSNSASNQRRRLLRTSEEMNSDNDSPLSNKKPRRSSGNKMPLRAIDSGHKVPTRKSTGSQINFVSDDANHVDESNNSEQDFSYNENFPVSVRRHSKSPRPSSSTKQNNSTITSEDSIVIDEDISFHNLPLDTASSDERKTKEAKMSSSSAKRQSTSKSIETVSDLSTESAGRTSLEYKKSPHTMKNQNIIKISPKTLVKKVKTGATLHSKMTRTRSYNLIRPRPKQSKVPIVSKKSIMTTSKKLKVLKKEQKHRSDVLKKVKSSVLSPKIKLSKGIQKSTKTLKTIKRKSFLLKPKAVRLSQKILQKAKPKKQSAAALRLSGKLVTSPKDSMKYGKRKSVVFRSRGKGIKIKKLSAASKLSSQKRKLVVGTSSPKIANKRIKPNKAANKKGDMKKKSISSVTVKRQSIDKLPEKITTKTRSLRKRKMPSGKFNSPETKKRLSESSKEKEDKDKTSARPVSRNQRKRKAATESSFENEIPAKQLKTPEKSKSKEKSKPKAKGKNTSTLSNKKNETGSLTEEASDSAKVGKNERSAKRKQNIESKVETPKLKKKTRSTRQQDSQNEDDFQTDRKVKLTKSKQKAESKSESPKLKYTRKTGQQASQETEIIENLMEVNDSAKVGKNVRSTKREQNIESKVETPKLKKKTRSTRQQDSQDEDIGVNAHKKPSKRSKTAENKKNELNNSNASSPKKNTRTTRRKNLQTKDNLANKETIIEKDSENDQKRGRKRKVDKSVKTPAKVPLVQEVSERKTPSEKDKKNVSKSKVTPIKGKGHGASKRGKSVKEASPVQRIQRSLRSRK